MTGRTPQRRIRGTLVGVAGLMILPIVAPGPAGAQVDPAGRDGMIRSAVSAAPDEVSRSATVRDWQGNVLREGTNGWTCLPDMADQPGDSPMCLDPVWMAWVDAWQNKKPFQADRVGFGYMLQGDFPTSNTDPYARESTPDNQWIENGGPHVMILVPDAIALEGLPRTPHGQGPYVMWEGTPYVHIMLPVPRKP
ncbi:MAG: hypothetical protein Q8W51_01880 [Candidatus Palauibacterales bacterium]|nr:hypothetical protein [Candidatus Palauibacterales bacterium]MDP2582994.1 hypothetical protein [Candidatus Palauibacterales bacterium]